jgi:hypothetical protein
MQTPDEQWYPDKIQPSPEGRKDADTGEVVAIVVDPASGATMGKTVATETQSTIETETATCSNLLRDLRTPSVSQRRKSRTA